MNRVAYQQVAKADLIDVWLFIAEDNMAAADAYIDRLQEASVLIAENPLIGSDRADIAEGVRSFAVDDYVIYYERNETGVTVLRVWHSARDPASFGL